VGPLSSAFPAAHAHPAPGGARWVTEEGVGAAAGVAFGVAAGNRTFRRPEFGVVAGTDTESRFSAGLL